MIKKTIKEITNVEKETINLMKEVKAQNKSFRNYMNIIEYRICEILLNNYTNVYDECIYYMIHGKIEALTGFYMNDNTFKYDYFSLKADLLNDLNSLISYELKLRENE